MNRPKRSGRRQPGVAVRAWWLRREWKALLLVLGLTVLALAVGLYTVWQGQRPTQAEAGVIVRFGTDHDYEGNSPLVLVRTKDGMLRQLHVHRSALAGCRRGDSIDLVRRGTMLVVHPAGCRRQAGEGR